MSNTTLVNLKGIDVREWARHQDHVYIGRWSRRLRGIPCPWGNPFHVEDMGRDECVEAYREYLAGNSVLMAHLPELRGKVLGCWCAPRNCHGLVLIEFINNL